MEEKIRAYMAQKQYAKPSDIYAYFDDSRAEIALALQKLVADGFLIHEDEHYVLPSTLGLLLADLVVVKDHFAFATLLETGEDVHLRAEDLNGSLAGDRVYLRHRYLFRVAKMVKRGRKRYVGETYQQGRAWFLALPGIASKDTMIRLDNYQGPSETIVVAELMSSDADGLTMHVLTILGAKNAPRLDVTRWILEQDAPIEFSPRALQEAQDIPLEVQEKDLLGREDFRHELIVTIDGDDARDLDDAVSAKKTANGYEIGVHIADVSWYVRTGSGLDEDARDRGTSIYVTDRVVPMLPFSLSNGICSLQEGVDRLTLSCSMTLSSTGEVVSSRIVPSIIHSQGRLTYHYVNEVIAANKPKDKREELILLLNEIAIKIRRLREARGSLNLDVPEVKIKVDENGHPLAIEKKIQQAGEKLIEDFMVLANETVASNIAKRHLPFIYRIHELPSARKLESYLAFSARLGHPGHFAPLMVKPIDLQKHLTALMGSPEKEILSTMLLRSLAKARYSHHLDQHFGLASSHYTHFTSPIRRYPDLLVHRLLRRYLVEEQFDHLELLEEELAFLADDTSMKERRAVTIERTCVDRKGAEYMSDHLGIELDGYIDGMTNNGLFVALENGLSGSLRFEDFHDRFQLNTQGEQAFSYRKGLRFQLGDRVRVIVVRADKEKGQITLQLTDESLKTFQGKSRLVNGYTKKRQRKSR